MDKLQEYRGAIKDRLGRLSALESKYDSEQQDILHYIEFNKYDAVTGSKLLKELRAVRLRRRAIKEEVDCLRSMKMRLQSAGLWDYKLKTQKQYKDKTDIIQKIL